MPKFLTKYHTIIEQVDGKWAPQFGDYSMSVVREELRDMREGSGSWGPLKIITTGDTQSEIEEAVAKLNDK